MKMLCPYCLSEVDSFIRVVTPAEQSSPGDERGSPAEINFKCPPPPKGCGETVPSDYIENYVGYPPLVFSLIGYARHGKTSYQNSLFHVFDRLGRTFRSFSYNAVGDADLKSIRIRLGELLRHKPPDATSLFETPTIIRVGKTPHLGQCQLITYDGGGEAFNKTHGITKFRSYLRLCPAAVWLVSLPDLEQSTRGELPILDDQASPPPPVADGTPSTERSLGLRDLEWTLTLDDLVCQYRIAMLRLGMETIAIGDEKKLDQRLVVVLTKGDLLLARPDLPDEMTAFLEGQGSLEEMGPDQSHKKLSDLIKHWLESIGYHNFVREAERNFLQVEYCVVSSWGFGQQGEHLDGKPEPRGVLHPLYWLQAFSLPRISVTRAARLESCYFSLREAIENAPPGAVLELTEDVFFVSDPVDGTREGISIDKEITLVGRETEGRRTRIVGNAAAYLIRYRGKGTFTARNIDFEREGERSGHVVWANSGTLDFRDCSVKGARGNRSGTLGGFGLFLTGDVGGEVSHSEFADNSRGGIYVSDSASPILDRNTCTGSQWGIYYCGSANGAAYSNLCNENSRSGINVDDRSKPTLGNNTCRDNAMYGIDIHQSARPVLWSNTCEKNKVKNINVSPLFRLRLLLRGPIGFFESLKLSISAVGSTSKAIFGWVRRFGRG